MSGGPAPGTLAAAPLPAVTDDVRAVIDDLRPDVVVTLDASDGHRDHAAIRDATLSAAESAGHPPGSTYLWCLARSSMARWARHVHGDAASSDVSSSMEQLGTPDEHITTRIDVTAHLPTRWAAIRAHASQASPYDDLPADLQHDFLATDRLRLVHGADLLAR